MATFDSAWCLTKFDQLAGRPDTDEITDAQKYQRLAEAQQGVIEDIAAVYPYVMYRSGGPTTLTTSDSKVYTFGSDGQGHAMAPLGHVAVFRTLANYPDGALEEGIDYLNEGTQIRIPNNRTEGTLYYTGIPTPADMTASVEPVLRPAPSRILIPIKAAERFGLEGGSNLYLADAMGTMYAREFSKFMVAWKTQFRKGPSRQFSTLDRALALQH